MQQVSCYIMVVVTDCEECNKRALLTLNSNAADETLPAELSLIVALPDVVHLGKRLKLQLSKLVY